MKPHTRHHLCSQCEHHRRYPPPPAEHKEPDPPPPERAPLFDRSDCLLSPLTIEQRWALVTLCRIGYNKSDVAHEISCSEKTVYHWIHHYEKYGNVDDMDRSGRPAITDENSNINIVINAVVDPFTIPNQILADLDSDVSARTVRRRLDEAGLFGRVSKTGYPFSDQHIKKRLSFANGYSHMTVQDWSLVIFSDETHFHIGHHGQRWVQRPKGEAFKPQYISREKPHEERVSVWGCFSSGGVGDIYLFDENLDAKLMKKILGQHLIQSSHRLFERHAHWWFLQDNDPKHRSNLVNKWLFDHGIQCMELPPYSPDLNPIENLWHNLKSRVASRHARDIEELKEIIVTEWNHTSVDFLLALGSSMPRRCAAVIAAKGDLTDY
ncbi:MAG TPA: IS630 family transposase [Candidatus Babeliaceae bacterium]|nr:IS630 family transposase [Candidatus Babeliaceae bacterium]